MYYSPEDLEYRNGTRAEETRINIILNDLLQHVKAGDPLEAHEADIVVFAYMVHGKLPNGVNVFKHPSLASELFLRLFPIYYNNLLGDKPVKVMGFNGVKRRVSMNEEDQVIEFLRKEAKDWESQLMVANATDPALNAVRKETQDLLKNLPSLNSQGSTYRRSARSIVDHNMIFLRSKFLYLQAKSLFSNVPNEILTLRIGADRIELSINGYVHILNRHFAEKAIPFHYPKTFHSGRHDVKRLDKELERVISEAVAEGIPIDICRVLFEEKGRCYIIRAKLLTNDSKGSRAFKLDTFYPVDEESEKSRLKQGCRSVAGSNGITYYIK